jgi:CRISPR/Cas system-associated exonuclease Cas4 (RecB family)
MQVIRASEIGEYVFCARAWWLRRVAGLEPAGRPRRSQGIRRHRRHGHLVAASGILRVLAIILLLLAFLALLFAV